MARLLAEDLLLLCWDPHKGRAHPACGGLDPGIGGALVLDALRADALTVHDGRVMPTDTPTHDALLRGVVAEATRGKRAPTVKALVQRIGTAKQRQQLLDRLVATGFLRQERKRLLGLIPLTRHPAADTAVLAATAAEVGAVLTGTRPPDDVDTHHLLLAALTAPTGALDVLVERRERKHARKRAEAIARGHGIPAAVGQAIADTQMAIVAAISAAVTVNQSTSNS